MRMRPPADETYILQRIAEGEHVRQDFKFAISDARKIAESLSAFANTGGGRLLVGVKDNGQIAGVRSEEEIYMVEAAATVYCRPPLQLTHTIHKVKGKDVLEVCIPESVQKPVRAVDEDGKAWAYVRICDENILATAIHLHIWRHNRQDTEVMMTYTEEERRLLSLLGEHGRLTLNQCGRLTGMNRRVLCKLLADFIRFGLVGQEFADHRFYFQLSHTEQLNDYGTDQPIHRHRE